MVIIFVAAHNWVGYGQMALFEAAVVVDIVVVVTLLVVTDHIISSCV